METENRKKKQNRREPFDLTIDSLAFGARGVARDGDFVWFVDRGLPGSTVRVKSRKRKRKYGEAFIIETLSPSPDQVEPRCRYFGTCGGCQLQHYDYSRQTEAKTQQIKDLLSRIAGIGSVKVQPTLPSDPIYHYRNKMEFTFSDRRWVMQDEPEDAQTDFALGLHIPRRFDKVLDIETCPLQAAECNNILRDIRELLKSADLKPYNQNTHEGFLRFLVIRSSVHTGEVMLNLITSSQNLDAHKEKVDAIAEELHSRHPDIVSFIHSISDKKAQIAYGDSERLVFGKERILEKIGPFSYEISAGAFFQTNSRQTETLFQVISDQADLKGHETLYDLYCGAGAIGIFLSRQVKKGVGIEVIPSAVEDARRNAVLNGLDNIEFVMADMMHAIEETEQVIQSHGKPDVVILDPPRGGTHPKTIQHLLNIDAEKIVYVSCNPAILARDLQILCADSYDLIFIQPVDMFPHTGHVEVVASLRKKK